MPGLTYKSVAFQLEELKARGDEGWSFSGYASTFGNIDEGGDVVLRGAFASSIATRVPRLLWQHDVSEPIGKVQALREDDRGLHGEFKISRTARGQDAYMLLKDGAIDSMSIGYIPEVQEYDDRGVRLLKSIDLLEISLVSIPMNEEARVTAVKTNGGAAPAIPPAQRGPSIASIRLDLMRKRLGLTREMNSRVEIA